MTPTAIPPDAVTTDSVPPDDIAPDDIAPDDKDWTWVLTSRCPECGFEPGARPAEIASAIREQLPRWRAVLARSTVAVRPSPQVWSPLEYSCHVRDVYRLFDQRLAMMLAVDGARFSNWDQDVTAVEGRYWETDPVALTAELDEAGSQIAASFAAVTDDQLDRTGVRSNGSVFTVHTFGWYLLHDLVHHLHDVAG